jgi:hypothetical protein
MNDEKQDGLTILSGNENGKECFIGEKSIIVKPFSLRQIEKTFAFIKKVFSSISGIQKEESITTWDSIFGIIISDMDAVAIFVNEIWGIEIEFVKDNLTLPQIIILIDTIKEQNELDSFLKKTMLMNQ